MADMIRWDPFRDMQDFRFNVDRLFNRGLTRPWGVITLETGDGLFPVDVYETDDDVVVKASLPGVAPDAVDVSVTGKTLTIKAQSKAEHEEAQPNYYRKERRSGSFQRVLKLPVLVDADKAKATFDQGVLNLRMPKAAEVRSKTIQVKAQSAAEAKA